MSTGPVTESRPKQEVAARRNLGKYTILAALGEGGMAQVFLASAHGPAGFNKLFVIKLLRSRVQRDDLAHDMFMAEARLAARLNHPNVVQTIEVSSDDDDYYMTMEYLEGQSLAAILQRVRKLNGAFPLNLHLRVLVDMLAGLDYAHRLEDFDGRPLRIVHRDVSPQNVIVTYGGHVKVLDFGIAKAADNSVQTETGVMKGKVAYMSPEQVCSTEIDCRADVYSVGVMLWEALAGRKMRRGMTEINILNAIINEEVPSPRTVVSTVDPELERIALKALARDPKDRYASAAEMQHDLDRALERLGPRVQPRELGALVAEMFASERSAIRKVVEMQMTSPSANVPSIALGKTGEVPGGATPSSSKRRAVASTGSSDAVDATALSPLAGGMTGNYKRYAILGAGALVVVVLIAVFLLSGKPATQTAVRDHASSASPAASTGPAAAAPAAPTAAASTHSLTVSVTPSSARISIDGVAVKDNPHSRPVPTDSVAHTVRAEAPGYVAREQTLTVDRDTQLTWTLDRVPSGGGWRPPPRSPPPPVVTNKPVATNAPPAPPAPTKDPDEPQIDLHDPYAK
jgi:serine/threonine-protein kinase